MLRLRCKSGVTRLQLGWGVSQHPMPKLSVALLFAAAVAALQSGGGPAVACGRSEATALRAPPVRARRVSKDRLAIRWARGTRVFRDTGVVEGEIGGTAYEYCGPVLGYHLIRKAEEGLITGVLLDTATGTLLPAGQVVMFAPDGGRYFATQQPDGLDGEEWFVYSRAGTRLWKGQSGISARSSHGGYDYFVATLEAPHWTNAGKLGATLRCASDSTRTAAVTLRATAGRLSWAGSALCASAVSLSRLVRHDLLIPDVVAGRPLVARDPPSIAFHHDQPQSRRAARTPVQGCRGMGSVARQAARQVRRPVAADRQGSVERQSVSYAEALDVALCYGWIDGQKKTFDDATWLQKFTPRGKRSIWSKINREKVQRLVESGRMQPPGVRPWTGRRRTVSGTPRTTRIEPPACRTTFSARSTHTRKRRHFSRP
jgi:Uncharacterized protein conserved in bacteria